MNAHLAFEDWYNQWIADGGQPPYGQDDMRDAFTAGWDAKIKDLVNG